MNLRKFALWTVVGLIALTTNPAISSAQFIDLNGDFRDGLSGWTIKDGRIDLSGRGHDDDVSARLRSSDAELTRRVAVRTGTNYRLRGRIETSGRFGYRIGPFIRSSTASGSARNFKRRTFEFNSGVNSSIEIFCDYRNRTGRFDSITLENLDGTESQMVHPGGWHTQQDLTTIREMVAARREPWITGWNAARNEGPDENFTTNPPRVITNNAQMARDGFAAWILTMKWVASGDQEFADAAIGVIDTWVDDVEDFEVFAPTLTVSTGAGAMAQAAEILAHGFNGEAGWRAQDVARAQVWFRDVVYEPQTNSGLASSANFGTSALGGNMSMAIFMDDEARYNFQRQAFITGYNGIDGCNSLTDYIPFASGQALETGRDQSHVQGGIAHLTEAALCMLHQGDDLVYLENNRLLAGVEYHARYNLGFNDLPYNPNVPDRCNNGFSFLNATEIGSEHRGDFSPVYYMSAQLFTKAGLNHPNTRAVLSHPGYSPEPNNNAHPGLGMFTFVPDPRLN